MFEQTPLVLVDRVQGVIAAFDINVRPRRLQKGSGVGFGKKAHGIHRFQGGQDGGAILLVVERARGAFESAHPDIAGDADQQGVALVARLLQTGHVAQMQDIKAAIGDDQFPARAPQILAPGAKRGRG